MTLLDDRAVAGLRALASEPGSGDVLADRFELREPIGEGGMGIVFAAWDREASREVAVKIVRADDADGEERFEREAAALAKIAHPAIVRYVARGNENGARFFVMDRLVGVTLAERLARGRLTVRQTLALGRRIAEGLAAVHREGIAHRDVKPSNVFLVDDAPAAASLLDFGLARTKDGVPLTAAGALVGTPGYMAPEQVRGDRAGPHADVFALGCVLFECLTGRSAFAGESTAIVLSQILLESPPLVRELRPEVPLALEGIVEQMLAKVEAARPDAKEVARELAALEAHLPIDAPNEASSAGLAEGAVIAGKYRIERPIGAGGMGVVFAARHLELGKRVALKVLRGGKGDEARFLREARAAARLESEHVARVLDVGRLDDGTPFIAMEHLSGVDLARRLLEGGPLRVDEAVGYLLEACEAIAEAHALGIVHRDLKPSNLFLTSRRDGSEIVKVLDFGISKVTRTIEDASLAAMSMTGATGVVGSVWYMSPEQLHDAKRVDARADIWALGVVLHELIAGSRPFEGESAAAVGARIAAGEPKRLRDAAPNAPAALEAVVLRCLSKDPERRFANLAAFALALAPFARGARRVSVERIARVLAGPLPPEAAPAPATPNRRGRAIAASLIALTLIVAAFVVTRKDPAPGATPDAPPIAASKMPTASSSAPAPPAPTEATPATTAPVTAPPPPSTSAPRVASARAAPPPPRASSATPPPAKRPPREVDLNDPALSMP